MNVDEVLAVLRSAEGYEEQIVATDVRPARDARTAPLGRPLPSDLADALRAAGVTCFYTHQAEAIDLLRDGIHTVVATGTASGKSLCYLVPIFEALRTGATAIYVAPTKALGADQLRAVRRYGIGAVRAETYDGDTPSELRAGIRRHANLLLTNPDMLHHGICPHHELWGRFLRALRYVVVDEAHALRGVFGSHVACVLRRLRRVARACGGDPVFALASATIGNPSEHATALTGLDVRAVTEDGAPSGERHTVFWNPPFLDGEQRTKRRAANSESSALLASLVGSGAKTLAFSKSRVSAELLARYARGRTDGRIAAYRAGYLPSERREIEDGLKDGRVAGVSATNALELGIDIGDLDAVVLNGFPGTIASARQQAGRAGRSGEPSLAVVVAQDEPLDQFYASHPEAFFRQTHEAALVNPSNPYVLGPHLGCAAYERPLHAGDEALFGPSMPALVAELAAQGAVRERRGRWYWALRTPPAPDVDIRSAGGRPFRIVEQGTGRLVGTVDSGRVLKTVHPGAIYLHQSETYRVTDLVLSDRVALVSVHDRANEYTQAKTDTDLTVLKEERTSDVLGGVRLSCGLVEVTDLVLAYRRKRSPGGEVLEEADLDLPPQTLTTRAVWYSIPEHVLLPALRGIECDEDPVLSSLHAAEHSAIGILPVFAMCDRWDIGGLSIAFHPDTGEPTIFIYDGHPMGAGIAEHAFAVARDHLWATLRHVRGCPCSDGCPSCIQSPKCGNWNSYLCKPGAAAVLDAILSA